MRYREIIVIVILIIVVLLIANGFDRKYRKLLNATIDSYETEISELESANVNLGYTNIALKKDIESYTFEISMYEDSIEYYRDVNEANYEKIVNASDSSNVELFYKQLSNYRKRFSISSN